MENPRRLDRKRLPTKIKSLKNVLKQENKTRHTKNTKGILLALEYLMFLTVNDFHVNTNKHKTLKLATKISSA